MTYTPLSPYAVQQAQTRIVPYIHRTPVLSSSLLNTWLSEALPENQKHQIFFKVEGLQKIGAFKVRGALNALLSLQEQGSLPAHVVAFSSGNHAQAVAYAAKTLGVKATILIPKGSSAVKIQATKAYGAEVIVAETRNDAEARVADFEAKGAVFIHPYDNDAIIAGQGTSCLEALQDGVLPNAIFASCGGGGWLSGTFLASRLLCPTAKVFAAEPLRGNDATQSYRTGRVVKLPAAPDTLADGARTLAISERTFHYLKQLDDFFEIEEQEMAYWTQWLIHLLKVAVEPTSAMSMAAAQRWLQKQNAPQKVLIMLSGGNIDARTYTKVFARDYLGDLPNLQTPWSIAA
jgi:threonine dehydratase